MDEQAVVTIRPLGDPGDLGWVVMAHAEEFGWNTEMEALIARIVADYAAGHDETREAAWIAEKDGVRVGCVFCVASDSAIAWSASASSSPPRRATSSSPCGRTTSSPRRD